MGPPGPEIASSYGYIYNTGSQNILTQGDIPFSTNSALLGITHSVGTAPITVENEGTYAVWFVINGESANQFALFQNDVVVPGSIYGTEGISESNIGMTMISAAAGDILRVRNHTSVGSITLDNSAGGSQVNISSSIMIIRIGPSTLPDPALAAVNAAQTIIEMRAAIENPQLSLDLTAFNVLAIPQQDEVLQRLIDNRPVLGYPTVSSVQDALNNEINQVIDPNNIYVRADSIGGNGSRANPFGTISQGVTAVNVGGTVHILEGTYPLTVQINVNKVGITLLGENNPMLLLQASIIPLLISASGMTVNGLTITSDVPYAREFIQVGGHNVSLVNNTIFGPLQPLPMSGWVVNRAVVSQNGVSNIYLQGNTFYSLRSGVYINPNTTGAINNNVVYNTKGGFLVDRAFTTFNGNSWGVPPNEFDIVLFLGTTFGPPYNDIPALQAANNNATVSDQR
ncbi:hypothetical protein [Cytobacillus massiliigabonensis]|uniref:hypothetical protein n=1 Tax=Cytobacillus massiliigabonensis TaxID=1871011 RepID=UPI001F4372F8|nr:hypothetical protein [Cytobacillus massiliigabonensis]